MGKNPNRKNGQAKICKQKINKQIMKEIEEKKQADKIERKKIIKLFKSSARSIYSEVLCELKSTNLNNDLCMLILSYYTAVPLPDWNRWKITITSTKGGNTSCLRLSPYATSYGKGKNKATSYLIDMDVEYKNLGDNENVKIIKFTLLENIQNIKDAIDKTSVANMFINIPNHSLHFRKSYSEVEFKGLPWMDYYVTISHNNTSLIICLVNFVC